MKTTKNFTLLEAVIAMLLLTLGLGILISQFALSGRRLLEEYNSWKVSHELVNACEYILSTAPDKSAKGLPEEFASEDFAVSRTIGSIQLPEELKHSNDGQMRIINWHVEIKDKNTGTVLDHVDFAGWVEAENAP